jgi:nitroreductase
MDFPSCASLMENWSNRAAVKRFDADHKIPESDWEFLRQAMALSPSSYGLQPYRIVEVRGAKLRRKLRDAAFDQPQVTDADRLLVLAIVTEFGETELEGHLERLRTIRGMPEEALAIYRTKVLDRVLHAYTPVQRRCWQARQSYIALGSLLWAAAQRGIDTCPIEAIQIPEWDSLLDLEWKGLTCHCACAVGYRSDDETYANLPKVRLPLEEFLLVQGE